MEHPMLLETRKAFRPFEHPVYFELFERQCKQMWLPDEIPMTNDVADFKAKLSPAERTLVTHLFTYFTDADVSVGNAYVDKYIPMFKNIEVRMMLTSFALMESIHIASYAHLIDTLNMDESIFGRFLEYDAMKDKHEYLLDVKAETPKQVAIAMAIFSAFTEGLVLYSTFAMLLSFARRELLLGMCGIIKLIAKDEKLHVWSMIKLFNEFIAEQGIKIEDIADEIYEACRHMVGLEYKFIDLAFEDGPLENTNSAEIKQYVRYTADLRLKELGLSPIYGDSSIEWIELQMECSDLTNFFEGRPKYNKSCATGGFYD